MTKIGGPENKKYFAKTFRELLQSVNGMRLPEQQEILEETTINWESKSKSNG